MIEYTTKYDVRKTMYQKFAESVAKRGDKPCFYYYNNTLTWNQVADLVDACAAGMLANGVRKGDRVIICAGYSFIHGDTVMGFESIFCFIFTHLWDLFQIFGNGSFIEEVPPLSQTLLNIIIFIGIVFGSYLELFDKLAHFDDFMHLLSGFVCAAFGFDFARIIQRKKGPCAVTLAAIFGLMFAVTIAAGWEFYEFLMDTLHGTNLQLAKAGPETAMFDLAKYHGEYGYIGLVDTMTDMMMNVVGGIVGMIFMIVLRTKGNKKPAAKAKK